MMWCIHMTAECEGAARPEQMAGLAAEEAELCHHRSLAVQRPAWREACHQHLSQSMHNI